MTAGYIYKRHASVRYLNEGLKSLVVLLELFEEADRFVVTTAEVAVHLLHFVFILI